MGLNRKRNAQCSHICIIMAVLGKGVTVKDGRGILFFGWEAYPIVQGKLRQIIWAQYALTKFLKVWWEMKIALSFSTFFLFHFQQFCSSVCQSVFCGSLQFKAENWERRKKQSKELWLGMCAISLFAMPHGNHSKHRKIKKTCQRQSGDLRTLWHTISCCSLTNWETQNLTLINLTWQTENDNGQPLWCLKCIDIRPRSNYCLPPQCSGINYR